MHHRGEQVQLADHALKGADLLLSGLLGIDLSLKPCRAPAQVRDARFELWLLNQPLGIAVDRLRIPMMSPGHSGIMSLAVPT